MSRLADTHDFCTLLFEQMLFEQTPNFDAWIMESYTATDPWLRMVTDEFKYYDVLNLVRAISENAVNEIDGPYDLSPYADTER